MVRSRGKVEDNRLPHKTLRCCIEGVRSRGRQRKTWIDNVKEDMEKKNADIETAMELIQNRRKWKHFVQPHRQLG